MKKLLALVLALVMVLSLCVVSSNAADFTDAKDVNYDEAVDVMKAIKVIDGFTDGSFQPKANLTRAQAAKIICNLVLGPTTADALVANSAPFADVPATHWAAGYIAYCASEGIINGVGGNSFDPEGQLTGYAFMKMLLGALGYDAKAEGYTGGNWSIQVAKRALNLDLDDGLTGNFAGNNAVTREEACLYSLNALNSQMVEYDNASTISVGDITIQSNSKAEGVFEDIGKTNPLLFREKYFEKLTCTSPEDAFGRPATKWSYDKKAVGTYADKADYVVVLNKSYVKDNKAATIKALAKYIQDEIDNDDLDYENTAHTWFNGSEMNIGNCWENATAGAIIELFTDKDADGDEFVETVVAYQYSVAKIDKVNTKLTAQEVKDDVTAKLTFKSIDGEDSATLADTKVAGYDADTYVKGAYVAYVSNDTKIISSYVVESVSGKVTAKGSDYVKIDGEKYVFAGEVGVALKDEATLFLSKEGYVLGCDKDESVDLKDVYYVTNVYSETKGGRVTTWYATAVALDGTVSELVLDSDDEVLYAIEEEDFTAGLYTLKEDDGAYTATAFDDADDSDADYDVYVGALAADVKKGATKLTAGEQKVYLSDDTEFVSIEDAANKALKVKTATGNMTCEKKDGLKAIVITKDGKTDALYVLYVGADVNTAVNTGDVVFVSKVSGETVDDGYLTSVYFMEDGSNLDAVVKTTTAKDVKFYTYAVDDDEVYKLKDLDELNKSGSAELKVDEETGWTTLASVSKHGSTISGNNGKEDSKKVTLEDVGFNGATVIDLRSDDDIDASEVAEITSVDELLDAIGDYTVTLWVYLDEGDITFVAVKTVAEKA